MTQKYYMVAWNEFKDDYAIVPWDPTRKIDSGIEYIKFDNYWDAYKAWIKCRGLAWADTFKLRGARVEE